MEGVLDFRSVARYERAGGHRFWQLGENGRTFGCYVSFGQFERKVSIRKWQV